MMIYETIRDRSRAMYVTSQRLACYNRQNKKLTKGKGRSLIARRKVDGRMCIASSMPGP